jgi:outer membrane protein
MIFIRLVAFTLLFGTLTIQSQDFGTRSKKVYSLQECIDIAVINNYDLMVNRQQVATASADLTNAFGNYLPRFDFNTGYSRILNPDATRSVNFEGVVFDIPGSSPDSYFMNANLSLPLFDGFSREANYDRAQNNLSSSNLSNEFSILNVKQMVYTQYVEVIKNSKIVEIRNENLQQSKFELSRLQALHEAGSIAITDLYAQEADIGNKEIELIISESNFNKTRATLLIMMGMNPDLDASFFESSLPSDIAEIDVTDFRKEIGSFGAAVNKALAERLDLKAFEHSLEASEARLKNSIGQYYPSIIASGGWRWNHTEFNEFSERGRSFLGLTLNFPVFSNFSTNLQVQASKLQHVQSEVQYLKKEQEVRQSVQYSFLNLETAEKQIEVSRRALFASEKNYESVSERYKAGDLGIFELTISNAQMITAQINRINAVFSYLQARNEVMFAIGLIK